MLNFVQFDNTYSRLPATFHHRVNPTPVPDPYLVAFNPDAARLLDLDPEVAKSPEFSAFLAGNKLLPGSEPLAMRYSGHQFGSYVPQLGDGRAILLGEVRNTRNEKWDLHLKGAGRTAFSRFGDGRAVLRSSIREFLCSEAMHALGIPTTRALCVIGTDMPVYREHVETGALLLRMAPSHVRFGTFEFFFHQQEHESLKILADYVIEQSYPHLAEAADRYSLLFEEVVVRTAKLVAHWQAIGFAHGVLNTDNMSILGLTLDYGPFGFIEDFDPGYICNHSDETGRYAFDQQAAIGYWNLACLGQALTPLVPREALVETINRYADIFNGHIHQLMGEKLGLTQLTEADRELWIDLLNLLAANRVDYTLFFRRLADFPGDTTQVTMFRDTVAWDAWASRYSQRITVDADRRVHMNRVNPKFILRNYLAQVAIERAEQQRDFSEIERLRNILRLPFDEQPENEAYAQPAPAWGKKLVISCSS